MKRLHQSKFSFGEGRDTGRDEEETETQRQREGDGEERGRAGRKGSECLLCAVQQKLTWPNDHRDTCSMVIAMEPIDSI